MKNFRLRDLLVLAGLFAVVFMVFGASTAEAGCGYGHAVAHAPIHTSYVHQPLVHGCAYPTFYQTFYNPWYFSTPYCGGIYW